MAWTSENYIGLHKEYREIVKELAVVLHPQYKDDLIDEKLIRLSSETASLATRLEGAAKNTKTKKTKEQYAKEASELYAYNQSIKDMLNE